MKLLRTSMRRVFVGAAVVCATASLAVAQTYQVNDLPTPEGGDSVARGLNNAGNVAGRSGTTFATQTRAFVSRAFRPFEILGTLPQGDYSAAFGINDFEQVVGGSNTATALQAFIWEPALGMQGLGALPGDNGSQAFAINNRGQVVGYSSGPQGIRAFIWSRIRGMEPLGTLPGGRSSMAMAVSDPGYVVGRSDSSAGARAFFWSATGGMVNLGALPGDSESQAMAVNDKATVVGFSGNGAQSRAFVWRPASGMAALPSLQGGDVARALGVNTQEQIVGFSTAPDHAYRAVLWGADGKVRDLNAAISQPASVLLVEAQAINNRGQILVYGFRLPIDPDLHENPGRMFILTPIDTTTALATPPS
jgi:probable HAF family extracellular repeat protein